MAAQIAANTLEGRALAMAERIERLQIQIEDEQDRCKEQCAPMREDLKEIWKEAKEGDLPEAAMRAYVKVRTAQRKAVKKLSDHERNTYESLAQSLGDYITTPLGAAVAKLGDPSPLTDEEKAKGYTAAFVKNGNRMAIKAGGNYETPF